MLTAEKLAIIDNDIETFRQCEHWVHMAMELRTDLFHYMSQPPVIDAGDPNNLPANLVKWVSWGETITDGLKKADAKIAELEARIASHVCAGPTTINLTENAAVQEFTAELRRELAEERNHVRQHKATIDNHAATIERLREQIRQAQQDAAKSPAPDIVRLQQDLQASEAARANAENSVAILRQFADKPLFDQYERFCNRIVDACRQGTSNGLISDMAEQALKDMGSPPF